MTRGFDVPSKACPPIHTVACKPNDPNLGSMPEHIADAVAGLLEAIQTG